MEIANNDGLSKCPVMILFFNRPDTLSHVFSSVREYRPTQLFLVQDGARPTRSDDLENIKKCREVVSHIDWPCIVQTNFADKNMSCDHREYTGISWCFQFVDRLIILEDDCVPSQSFYHLCEENLERYKNNTHIHSIYGFNRVGRYDTPYDYVFSKTAAGCGWATWKRVWDKVEEIHTLHLFDDSELVNYIRKSIGDGGKKIFGDFIDQGQRVKSKNESSGINTSWEYVCGLTMILNDMVTIVPAVNMIKYLGISENATHAPSLAQLLPHKIAKVLTQPSYDIDYHRIKHPPFILRDTHFESLSSKAMKYPPFIDKIEVLFRRILHLFKFI